jgi:hypothetical protein
MRKDAKTGKVTAISKEELEKLSIKKQSIIQMYIYQ